MADLLMYAFQVASVMVVLLSVLWLARQVIRHSIVDVQPVTPAQFERAVVSTMAFRIDPDDDFPAYVRLPRAAQLPSRLTA